MVLEERTYKIKELAEWFEITPSAFSAHKESKLKELSRYCDFIDGGRRGITITQVYIPEYVGKTRKIVEKEFDDAWGENPGSLKRTADNIYNKYISRINVTRGTIYNVTCAVKREWYGVPRRQHGSRGYCQWVYAVVDKENDRFRYLTDEEQKIRNEMYSIFFKDNHQRMEEIAKLNQSRQIGEITSEEFTEEVLKITGMVENGDWDAFNLAFMERIGEDCGFALELIECAWTDEDIMGKDFFKS